MNNLILYLYVLATSSALIVLKFATKAGAPISYIDGKIHLNLNPFTILGLFLYAISFIAYTYLIAKFDLGYIVPIMAAFVYIIVFSASFIIFKEVFTLPKILGISLIVGGLILINIKK